MEAATFRQGVTEALHTPLWCQAGSSPRCRFLVVRKGFLTKHTGRVPAQLPWSADATGSLLQGCWGRRARGEALPGAVSNGLGAVIMCRYRADLSVPASSPASWLVFNGIYTSDVSAILTVTFASVSILPALDRIAKVVLKSLLLVEQLFLLCPPPPEL